MPPSAFSLLRLSFLLKYVFRFINFVPTQISNPHKGTAYNYLLAGGGKERVARY